MTSILKRGKELILFSFAFLVLIINNNLVFAQGYFGSSFIEEFANRIWNEGLAPIFGLLFGTGVFDEFLFAKILFFFIVFAIVFMVLKNTGIFASNRGATIIVTVAISILSVRFMGDNEFIRGVLLPYQVLGVSLIVFMPLLIYASFVQTSVSGKFGRRFAWVLYIIIFVVLWVSRQGDVRTADVSEINWIYGLGLAFIALNLIFDGPIHEYLGSTSFRKARRTYHTEEKGRYAEKLEDIERRRHLYNPSEYERLKREYTNRYAHHARRG